MPEIVSQLQKLYDPKNPHEMCGLILNDTDVYVSVNKHPRPDKGFVVDPEDLIKFEDSATATWHTHVGDTANLSTEDYRGFNQWPEWRHYVVGVDGVRCFTVEDGLIVEVPVD